MSNPVFWMGLLDSHCRLSPALSPVASLAASDWNLRWGPWSWLLLAVSRTVDGPCYQQPILPAASKPCRIVPLLVSALPVQESLLPPHSPSLMQQKLLPLPLDTNFPNPVMSAFYNLLAYTNLLRFILSII